MIKQIYNGKIHTPSGWVNGGSIVFENGKILEVKNDSLLIDGAEHIDADGAYVTPGGIETHCHGGGGAQLPRLTLSMALPPYSPLSALRRNR